MDGAYNKIVEESVNREIPDEVQTIRKQNVQNGERRNYAERGTGNNVEQFSETSHSNHDKNEAMKYAMERGMES